MHHVVQRDDGTWYGWGHVLDYVGVEWREPWKYLRDGKAGGCNGKKQAD